MKSHTTEGPPCRHMESLLQDAAEGRITGLKKLYAIHHAARCYRCGNFLERMKLMLQALQGEKDSVPEDAISRLKDKYGGSN